MGSERSPNQLQVAGAKICIRPLLAPGLALPPHLWRYLRSDSFLLVSPLVQGPRRSSVSSCLPPWCPQHLARATSVVLSTYMGNGGWGCGFWALLSLVPEKGRVLAIGPLPQLPRALFLKGAHLSFPQACRSEVPVPHPHLHTHKGGSASPRRSLKLLFAERSEG